MSWIRFLLAHPWLGWLQLVLVIAVSIPGILQLRVDNSLENWFLDDEPVLAAYHRFQDKFGNDETILLLVETDRLPAQSDLQDMLVRLHQEIARLPHVDQVFSLYHPILQIGQLLGTITPTEMDLFRTQVPDATVFWLALKPMEDPDKDRSVLLDRLDQLQSTHPELRFFRAGYGIVYQELNRITLGASAPIILGSYIVITVVLIVSLRRLRAVLAALLGMSVAFAAALGIYGYAGWSINMVSLALPSLLLAVTIADAMHVLKAARLNRVTGELPPASERAAKALQTTLRPCLFTSLTTFVGFLSLGIARIEIIREFGLAAAVAIMAAFVLIVLVTMPLTLPWVLEGEPARSEPPARFWIRSLALIQHHAPAITILLGGAFLTLIAGIPRLQVDTFNMGFLLKDNPVRRSSAYIEETYGNYLPFNLLIETSFDQRSNPGWHSRIEAFEAAATGQFALQKGITIASLAPMTLTGVDTAFIRLVQDEGRLTRIIFRAPMVSAATIDRLGTRTLELANTHLGDSSRVELAGFLPLYSRFMDYLLDGLLKSFSLALLVISILMWISLHSAPRMLLSLIPNLLPVLGTLGLMGWLHIPLDIATITIASIVLSVIVDDTIHFLHHYYLHRRESVGVLNALEQAMEGTGSAIVSTSAVLIAGMMVLLFAQTYIVIYFGLLLAFSIGLALICDLIFLPALLLLRERY